MMPEQHVRVCPEGWVSAILVLPTDSGVDLWSAGSRGLWPEVESETPRTGRSGDLPHNGQYENCWSSTYGLLNLLYGSLQHLRRMALVSRFIDVSAIEAGSLGHRRRGQSAERRPRGHSKKSLRPGRAGQNVG